jgi:hypothetical protein
MCHIREQSSLSIPPYTAVNAINFTEENPTRMFSHWVTKAISLQGSGTEEEIQSKDVPMRCWEIYSNICEIGPRITQVLAGKTPTGNALASALKSNAMDLIPLPETLAMLAGEKFTPLEMLYDEYLEPQDVCLDNEYIWPEPPELEF